MLTQTILMSVFIGTAVVLSVMGLGLWLMRNLLYVCRPNEILVFSGRRHETADGRESGFQVVHGGRAWRIPIVERVDRMDMGLITVPMSITGAYSKGGIPLSLNAVANVKISSDGRLIGNAIERFLGHGRSEIAKVAKETLEGHLRGVIATMTPEALNEDRLTFVTRLEDEASEDLHKLGLHLDTLKIQQVSDEVNYLDSIGRKRIAEILRVATVAESDAARKAEEAEAQWDATAKVAEQAAQTKVVEKSNEMRRIVAELEAKAKSAEEQITPAAEAARALAEKELQTVRAELERLRLKAEVSIPAEASQRVAELEAAGRAARIAENGRALAQALSLMAVVWEETNGRAMDIVVLQNLEELFQRAAEAAKAVQVKDVSLIDSGDGQTLPNYVASYPATMRSLLDEVSQTMGVDVAGSISSPIAAVEAAPAS